MNTSGTHLIRPVFTATHRRLEYSASVARTPERLAHLAADRDKLLGSQAAHGHGASQEEGVQYARKCIGDIMAGFQNYGNELPEVQRLLGQLGEAIAAARQSGEQKPAKDTMQLTLQAAFQRQAAELYQIGTSPPTPEPEPGAVQAAQAGPQSSSRSLATLSPLVHASAVEDLGVSDMLVVGECLGDKR